jgi:hypothetical protein
MEPHLRLLYCSILQRHDVVCGIVIFTRFHKLLNKLIHFPGIVYIYTVSYSIYVGTGQYGPMGLVYRFVGWSSHRADGREGSRWAGRSGGRVMGWMEGRGSGWPVGRAVGRVGHRDGVWLLV